MSSPPSAPLDVLAHVVDVHCHPSQRAIERSVTSALVHTICPMASRPWDQPRVRALAEQCPGKVTPAFGYHPWFTHHIALTPPISAESHYRSLFLPSSQTSDAREAAFSRLLPALPQPIALSDLLADLRQNLNAFPNAMVGEVGIDRASRVPFIPIADDVSVDRDDHRELSPFTIPIVHQLTILEAQLEIAMELRRNVSLHSVKAAQQTRELFDTMKMKHGQRWRDISVDLHSCGVSLEVWSEIEKRHPNVFLSLSTAINARSPNHRILIKGANPSRLLAESDQEKISESGKMTWDMICTIAEAKGWRIEDKWDYPDDDGDKLQEIHKSDWGVVKRLEMNWRKFIRGKHSELIKRSGKDKRIGYADPSKWGNWGESDSGGKQNVIHE
ncbi:TatD DNase family Scn1 [Dentipellis sp. KUC8613]|nr:TatD DNase family Scn1 [Dentipellis sp. KUC8613]